MVGQLDGRTHRLYEWQSGLSFKALHVWNQVDISMNALPSTFLLQSSPHQTFHLGPYFAEDERAQAIIKAREEAAKAEAAPKTEL